MSKVTLLALNAKYVHSSLAIWYLVSAVSRFSRTEHEVEVIEATVNQSDSYVSAQVIAAKPGILGISVYIWNAGKIEALLRTVKTCLPEIVIVLGGPEASHNAAYWLSQGADFVVEGEGERSFPMLLDALAENGAVDTVPGLWRYVDGHPRFTFAEQSNETVIDPYTDAYFSALRGRIAYLETSRGCPFRCAFCLSGGSRLRYFPLNTAKEQLLKLSQSGTRTIKLVDRTFNCNADRAYEIFEYVIGLDTECTFHFEVAADLFDERTISLLNTAPPGRIQLEAGLQSFHQPTLDAVARKTSLEKAERNIKAILHGQNIHVHVDLIAGLPMETLEIFKQSFNRAYAIGAHTLQLGFLKLLHGSELRAQAERLGIRSNAEPPYEIISSPWLTAEDLSVIKQAEHALQRVYNSGRFIETVRYVLSAAGITPFELYQRLGTFTSGHGVPLENYAEQLYICLSGLPGVDSDVLRDSMVCDWLSALKGENLPDFLRTFSEQTRGAAAYAARFLGRKITRCEAAVLRSGESVFVDSRERNPVTGRYTLYKL